MAKGVRQDIIVFVLIIILAFLLGYNGIYKSHLNKINAVKREIKEEKEKSDLLGMIAILDRQLQAHKKMSLSTAEITPLLDRVSELAKEAGLQIATFNPQPAIYAEQYIELPIKIPLRCGYHQLGQFLSLIESNPEFIWVKELKVEKATVTEPKEKRIPNIDITVSGLYLKK